MSQRELARRAETSRSTVDMVERGRLAPCFTTWLRLLTALGVAGDARLHAAEVWAAHHDIRFEHLQADERAKLLGLVDLLMAA